MKFRENRHEQKKKSYRANTDYPDAYRNEIGIEFL